MLNNKEINIIINKYYDELLNIISYSLNQIFNNNYYEKINNKYINRGKMEIEKFKYIKDILPYYEVLDDILNKNNEFYYKSYEERINFCINTFVLAKLSNESYKLRSKVIKKFLKKIKQEKIKELLILYKLKRR